MYNMYKYIYICIVMVKYDFFYSQVGEVSQWGEMGIVSFFFNDGD